MKCRLLSLLLGFLTLSHATNLTIINNLDTNSNITDVKFRIGSPKSGQEFVKLDDMKNNSHVTQTYNINATRQNILNKAIATNETHKVPIFLLFTVPANTFTSNQPKLFYSSMFWVDQNTASSDIDINLTKTDHNNENGNPLLSLTINNDKITTAVAYPSLTSSTHNWATTCGAILGGGCTIYVDYLGGNAGLYLMFANAFALSGMGGNFSSNYSLAELARLGSGTGGNTLQANFWSGLVYSHGEVMNGNEQVAWFNGGGVGLGYAGGDSKFCRPNGNDGCQENATILHWYDYKNQQLHLEFISYTPTLAQRLSLKFSDGRRLPMTCNTVNEEFMFYTKWRTPRSCQVALGKDFYYRDIQIVTEDEYSSHVSKLFDIDATKQYQSESSCSPGEKPEVEVHFLQHVNPFVPNGIVVYWTPRQTNHFFIVESINNDISPSFDCTVDNFCISGFLKDTKKIDTEKYLKTTKAIYVCDNNKIIESPELLITIEPD